MVVCITCPFGDFPKGHQYSVENFNYIPKLTIFYLSFELL